MLGISVFAVFAGASLWAVAVPALCASIVFLDIARRGK